MTKMNRLMLAALAGLASAAAPVAAQNVQIDGAGATFPYPIYSKWFSEYNKLHPNVQINYQSIGSGGGIRQLTTQTVFFGASDGPMTDEQLKAAPGADAPLSDRARRRRARLQHPRRDRRAEVHRPAPGRHLPRQGDEVERSGDREGEPGREAPRHGHHRRPPRRRLRDDATSGATTSSKVSPGVEGQGRRRHLGELAGRRGRQGQRRGRRAGRARPPARSATSS